MKSHFLSSLFICLFLVLNCFGQKDKDEKSSSGIAALSLENPTGIGGFIGTVGIGIAGQHKTRSSTRPDGNGALYLGLGDPINYIGIGTSLSVYGLSNSRGTRENRGESGFNMEITKFLLKILFLKVGVCNLAYWGTTKEVISAQKSFYGSATVILPFNKNLGNPFSYLSITAGAGNGFFRKDKDFTPVSSGSFNPYVSVAIPVVIKTNAIVEWTGHDIATGISTNIPSLIKVPLTVNLEVTDYLLKRMRFCASMGYSFNLYKKYKYEKK